MSRDVAIANLGIDLAFPGPTHLNGETLVYALLNELEKELDARLPHFDDLIAIPRIEFNATCYAESGEDWISLIAERIAGAIVEATSDLVGAAMRPEVRAREGIARNSAAASEPIRFPPSQLVRLARETTKAQRIDKEIAIVGSPLEARTPLWSLDDPADDGVAVDSRVALRWLGGFARRRELPVLACLVLDHRGAWKWIERVFEALDIESEAEGPVTEGASRLSLHRAQAAALQAFAEVRGNLQGEAGGDMAAVLMLCAASEMVRLAPNVLLAEPSAIQVLRCWAESAAPWVADTSIIGFGDSSAIPVLDLGVGGNPLTLSTPDQTGEIGRDAERIPDARAIVAHATGELALVEPGDTHFRESEQALETATSHADLGWLFSQAAGLGFLLGPLADLGVVYAMGAVRPFCPVSLYWILRRMLALRAPALILDPAPWLFAGLLGAPDDADRSTALSAWTQEEARAFGRSVGADVEAPIPAFDAWAAAAWDEACGRMSDVEEAGRVLGTVISLRGTLLDLEDAIEIHLEYPEAYESLLRAGLLFDLESVPWLDDRGLRFVFAN